MLHTNNPEVKAILKALGIDTAKTTRVAIIFEPEKAVRVEVEGMMTDDEGKVMLRFFSKGYTIAEEESG